MGGILSRFSSRKDEKPATDSRSAATIRKRWSWRSNKKPSDVGGTTVNRSSTMPTRTRLQPTEEIPEDRKHDDIFDSEHDEKNYSNSVVTSNQNDHTSQHSSGQQEQHNVEYSNKPIVHEIPGKKDEKQPIQISSTNEPENKDNVTREISTEEAELLISHALPNQENVGPHGNITGSGTNGSLTHDNINFNHTEDLIVNKQQLEEKLDHSIHDSGLMMDQQEITKDQNGFFDSTQHHFEDKTDLLKEDDIHSEITGEEIKLGQNPPVYLPSEEIEEFVHQNIRKHDSNEHLKVQNDIIEQGGEENLSTESSNHNEVTQPSPVICFYRPNVVEYPPPEEIQLNDIDEQTYKQQTNNISNIQSSGTVGEKDSIHDQVVQNESFECSAELRAFHDLSNNEELPNSELIDKDNKVNFVETENTLDNVISEHVEQKNAFQETLEKELSESLMNAGETKIVSADEPPINLNDEIHVEQTENISHPKYTEHDAPIDEEATPNELDKCSSQPGLTYDPVPSLSPITTEPINLDDDMHAEQTEKISHPENMESINLGDEIHVEQTENISHPKYTEHDAPIDEEATPNELDKCSSQPGLTYDPVPSLSPITTEPINLDDDMHAEQTEKISHPENMESINLGDEIHVEQTENISHPKYTEHDAPIDEEATPNELDKCSSQPGLTYDPVPSLSPITTEPINLDDDMHAEQTEKISHPENMESINLGDEIHVEQTENISHPKYTEHDAPIDEEATPNELDKCSSQPGLTYDPVPSLSPITTEPINLDDDMHAEQTEKISHPENMESINLGDEIHVEQTENISHPKYTEHDAPIDEEATPNELDKCSSQPGLTYDPVPSLSPITTEPINLDDEIHAEQNEYTSPSERNVNNNIPVEKSIHTVLESPTEPVTEYNFSSNESHFTSELVLNEDNKEVTKDVDLEHSTEHFKTEDIHHKQINDTETLTTFEESVSNLHNTLNSTHIDDEIDQHQTLETSHDENHTDVQLNTDIMNVITSENLHTNFINANDEFEDEAQSLVQSVLNNAKEFVFNENNFENHQNSDTINTNLILTNNNSNNNDYLTNNNSYINEEDTIEMKQNMTMKTSMEFDHSDLSESNNQHLNNTNDLTIA
ncbi:unnamed protein product [Schistosoma rodhaini]|nr:unnamed protein product [Schistosoma rodhaini]